MNSWKNKQDEGWNVGVDTIDHYKFKLYSFEEFPHFYKRVFTQEELDYSLKSPFPVQKIAGIFAAKEATYKALSQFGETYLSQIEIKYLETGQPVVCDRFYPNLGHSRIKIGNKKLITKVSISHATTFSTAFALVGVHNPISKFQEVS